MAAVAICCAPAKAQNQSQVVTQFDDATISRLLLDVQATWRIDAGAQGRSVYRASADGGIAFTLSPGGCGAETGCTGIVLIATFARNDARSLTELDQLLNFYNDANPTAKVYRTGDGVVILQSYVNAVNGVSYANARAQMLVFGQEIGKLRQTLTAFSEGGQ